MRLLRSPSELDFFGHAMITMKNNANSIDDHSADLRQKEACREQRRHTDRHIYQSIRASIIRKGIIRRRGSRILRACRAVFGCKLVAKRISVHRQHGFPHK